MAKLPSSGIIRENCEDIKPFAHLLSGLNHRPANNCKSTLCCWVRTIDPSSKVSTLPTVVLVPGRTMRTLLEDADAEWNDQAFAELLGPGESGELGWMLRAGRFKYVWSGVGDEALFDLQADPGECENLVSLPEHAELIAELWVRFESLASETSWSVRRPRR